MGFQNLDVAKESSVQSILSKIKEGSGIHIIPEKETISVNQYYQNGVTGGDYAAVTNCNGTIYYTQDDASLLYKYDPDSIAATYIGTIPTGIDVHETSFVSFKGELHILGGYANRSKIHYKFDGKGWRAASSLPYDFCHGRAIEYNEELHIFGGSASHYTDHDDFINNHYKWDGETWSKASDLPYVVDGATVFVCGGKLHIVGGYSDNATKHYVWDGNSWSSDVDLPMGRYNSSAVTISDSMVYIAGGNEPGTDTKLTSTIYWNGSAFVTLSAELPENALSDCPYCMTYDNNNTPMIIAKRFFKLTDNKWVSQFSFGYFDDGIAEVFNDELHVFYAAKHYSFSPSSKGLWDQLGNNKYNAIGATAVTMEDGIHLLGSASTSYADYHCLWDGESWKMLSNLPGKLVNGSAVNYKGNIHIIGGTSMNEDAYNHYKLLDSKWVPVGSTLTDVVGTRAATVLNDSIYAIGINSNNKIQIIRYDGNRWLTIANWENEYSDTNFFITTLNGRLYTFTTNPDSNRIDIRIFLTNNDGIITGEYIKCSRIGFNMGGLTPTIIPYRGYIHIIRNETGSHGNNVQYTLVANDLSVLTMWIPKNHQFICDKSKFFPIVGKMEETDNGYMALETGCFSIYASSYDEPYTVC